MQPHIKFIYARVHSTAWILLMQLPLDISTGIIQSLPASHHFKHSFAFSCHLVKYVNHVCEDSTPAVSLRLPCFQGRAARVTNKSSARIIWDKGGNIAFIAHVDIL